MFLIKIRNTVGKDLYISTPFHVGLEPFRTIIEWEHETLSASLVVQDENCVARVIRIATLSSSITAEMREIAILQRQHAKNDRFIDDFYQRFTTDKRAFIAFHHRRPLARLI